MQIQLFALIWMWEIGSVGDLSPLSELRVVIVIIVSFEDVGAVGG